MPELGIDFIDTADAHGPNVSEEMIRDALRPCGKVTNGIGFIPWYPLASGKLAGSGGLLDRVARSHGATAGQIALALALEAEPVTLPIPGTGQVAHLEENVGSARIRLSDAEFAALDEGGRD